MIVVLVGAVYFRSNNLNQAHYILHQMFLAPEPLSVPNWMASTIPSDIPIGTFTLFSEMKDTVLCLVWTAALGCFALVVPVPAANPEKLVPSHAKAFAMASMAWLIIAFIGHPRTFLYFAF